jgi:uncharacterized protein YqgC (DUF456 family)
MTRNHWMLLGFFLAILGMVGYAVAPVPARIMLWLGVALAWFGIAVAINRKPWSPGGKRVLQILVGASALAIAMTATRLSLAGIALAAVLGGVIGAFASQWSVWIARRQDNRG